MSNKRKISDVVLEMLRPLLKEAKNIRDEKKIIGMGVIAWNLGVIKTYKGEDEMRAFMQNIRPPIPEGILDILMEHVERKCSKYKKYDQFIYDYELTRIPGDQINLSVAYESVN